MSKSIEETTTVGNIPIVPVASGSPTGRMSCGTPFFKCNDDMFFSLHLKRREKGKWFNKHYKDSNVAGWARQNKNKKFYLQHETLGYFRKVS